MVSWMSRGGGMGGQCVLYDLYEGVAVVVWCLVHVRMSGCAQAL